MLGNSVLTCAFKNFDAELQSLPGEYAAPQGTPMLAMADGEVAGYYALSPIADRRSCRCSGNEKFVCANSVSKAGLGQAACHCCSRRRACYRLPLHAARNAWQQANRTRALQRPLFSRDSFLPPEPHRRRLLSQGAFIAISVLPQYLYLDIAINYIAKGRYCTPVDGSHAVKTMDPSNREPGKKQMVAVNTQNHR